jgi:hypothetical protein
MAVGLPTALVATSADFARVFVNFTSAELTKNLRRRYCLHMVQTTQTSVVDRDQYCDCH